MYKKVGLRVATRLYLLYSPFFFSKESNTVLRRETSKCDGSTVLVFACLPFWPTFPRHKRGQFKVVMNYGFIIKDIQP